MSALATIATRAAAAQCVDLVRRFPWIAEADVPAPRGVLLLVAVADPDGNLGPAKELYAEDSVWHTHWFPSPRQPAGSEIIDDDEVPTWPEREQTEAERICSLTLAEYRTKCKEGDFVRIGPTALALHQLATDPRGPQQIGKQRAIAIRLRLLVKWQDRARLRRRIEAERAKS